MKITKKAFTILFLLSSTLFSSSLFAQAPAQGHEIGVRARGITDFDFIYKKQKAEKRFVRFRAGSIDFDFAEQGDQQRFATSLGFAIGWERRVPIVGKLSFIHAPEPFVNFRFTQNISPVSTSSMRVTPGFGYVLGFMYDISDKFYVNIETTPSISGSMLFNRDGLEDAFSANLGFNSNAVALSFVYKFQKAKKDKK